MTKITNRVFIWLQCRADALAGPNSIKPAGSWQQREREREQKQRFSPHYLSDSKVCPADNNAVDVYESAFYHSLG